MPSAQSPPPGSVADFEKAAPFSASESKPVVEVYRSPSTSPLPSPSADASSASPSGSGTTLPAASSASAPPSNAVLRARTANPLFRLVGALGPALDARKALYRQGPVRAGGKGGEGDEWDENEKDTDGKSIENEDLGVKAELGLYSTAFNMLCYAIALGVLSIPAVVANIGVVPFVLLNVLFAGFHWYTGLMYWQLKLRYPRLQNLGDAGHLLYGRVGGAVFAAFQLIFSIFLQGNHILLGATAFYELGWRGTCAIALAVVFAVISFAFTLPRSYKLFSFFAVASISSITVVVVFAMVAANVSGPQNAPPGAPPVRVAAFGPAGGGGTSFLSGMNSVTNLLVSYGSTPAYIPCMSEMRRPEQFKGALAILILVELVLYTVVGGVIVRALGQYTTSPSLSSLSPLLSKIGYGLALPVILIAGCAAAQPASRQLTILVHRRLTRGAPPGKHRDSKKRRWTIWILVNIFTWTCAFILAELIPFFSSFLSVESSLFWSVFILFATLFHLFMIREDAAAAEQVEQQRAAQALGEKASADAKAGADVVDASSGAGAVLGAARVPRAAEGTWRPLYLPAWLGGKAGAYALALGIMGATAFLCVAGITAAAEGIKDAYATGNVGRPFSCNVS